MKNAGLSNGEWVTICACLKTCKNLRKAVLFGARTITIFPPDSPLEIMLYGENMTSDDIEKMQAFLAETMSSYTFEFVLYDPNNLTLKDHIDRYNMEIPFNKLK